MVGLEYTIKHTPIKLYAKYLVTYKSGVDVLTTTIFASQYDVGDFGVAFFRRNDLVIASFYNVISVIQDCDFAGVLLK